MIFYNTETRYVCVCVCVCVVVTIQRSGVPTWREVCREAGCVATATWRPSVATTPTRCGTWRAGTADGSATSLAAASAAATRPQVNNDRSPSRDCCSSCFCSRRIVVVDWVRWKNRIWNALQQNFGWIPMNEKIADVIDGTLHLLISPPHEMREKFPSGRVSRLIIRSIIFDSLFFVVVWVSLSLINERFGGLVLLDSELLW